MKNLTGFSNPLVYDKKELSSLVDEYFSSSNSKLVIEDVYFKNISDSTDITRVIGKSLDGSIQVFDKKGKRVCIDTSFYCSAVEFSYLQKNGELVLGACNEADFLEEDEASTLEEIYSETDYLSSNDSSKNPEYTFIYFWSSYTTSKKRLLKDYNWFVENVQDFSTDSKILRINCDLLDEWGLKKGGEVPITFEKNSKMIYELKIGEIPFENRR